MNFVFGLAIAAVTGLLTFAVLLLIPKKAWALLPPDAQEWRMPIIKSVAGLVALFVFATNFGAYGPRNELPKAAAATAPERVEAEVGQEWGDTRDRYGEADARLEEAPTQSEELEDRKWEQ